MPRLIDHAAREVEVAEAAWRVVVRDGVRALSVRTVAAEAGLATASLRRAFPTQQALLAFSLELVARRVRQRIAALPPATSVREAASALLAQLLPLDGERRTEMEVFLLIGSLAHTDPQLRHVHRAAHAELGTACRRVVEGLVGAGWARGDLDTGFEARRLHALVDGLALHLVRQEEGEAVRWAVEVLEGHLDGLAAQPSSTAPTRSAPVSKKVSR
ncbi:TetR/AcrR family transcriptional regulator [Kineococcus glutinatus]|uniref:TetR/AcrR family transcriptional regulator n=1 Tax=Kineococcus glutinatus TaxID=1070872 RepID=UPI0031EC7E89